MLHALRQLLPLPILICGMAAGVGAGLPDETTTGKHYNLIDGKVDARTYNGFRIYQGSCAHCHGPDGMGSTFGMSLIKPLPQLELFRRVVRDGKIRNSTAMKGFADDPNIAPYIDDIYAYLQARADGAIGRGRPLRQAP